jgi:ATP-dependent Clp protease ATP-binding subunit ClpB
MYWSVTASEYRKYIERDPALERRFNQFMLKEPSVGVTIILRILRSNLSNILTLSYHDKQNKLQFFLTNT